MATSTKIDVVGVPVGGNFTLGNNNYPSTAISSVTGEIKMGHSVAPYVGVGFGNPVGAGRRLTVLLDLGAVLTGTPIATVNVACAAATPAAVCAQIQQDAQMEVTNLESNTKSFKVWPAVNLGLAYRF